MTETGSTASRPKAWDAAVVADLPYDRVKRVGDVLIAAALLVVGSPILLIAAAAVRKEDGGPVLYRAPRVGRGDSNFTMYKLRTMVVDADRIGGSSTSATDSRLTRTGRRLRRWKIDEFPQLVNVLLGDMSLVGPRPQVRWDVERYTAEERRLLSVRPGITDWASIRFRHEAEILAAHADPDEAYDRLIRPHKIRLGLAYVARRSFKTDARILFETIAVVLDRTQGNFPSPQYDRKATHADR